MATKTTATTITSSSSANPNSARNERKVRQVRMFIVIIIIITLFFILRLPTWIYLLIKIHKTLVGNFYWVINYVFGILSLLNCVVNPFIYTFLTETIIYSTKAKKSLQNCFGSIIFGCYCKKNILDDNENHMEKQSKENTKNKNIPNNTKENYDGENCDDGGVYVG